MSPLIWLLIADMLVRSLNSSRFFNVAFADDFSIVVRGKFLPTVFERMSEALVLVNDFTYSTDLSVNPDKVGIVLFTKKRKFVVPRLEFRGKELNLSSSWKVLGVTFDSKLNWSSHLESRVAKSCRIFGQCRRAIGRTWGLSPKGISWLYNMAFYQFCLMVL